MQKANNNNNKKKIQVKARLFILLFDILLLC